MRRPPTSLWFHLEFLKLWVGQTVSLFGSEVTDLALPLTAVLVLQATPAQMGALGAVEYAPALLVGLVAGVWIDRLRRRPVLLAADLGRALLLASVPAAALLHRLHLAQLYVVGFLAGTLTVCFDVAYQSYLPALVHRARLVEGNSRLEMSRAVSQVAGPGLAGGLVQLLTAPVAILADAASFLASAAALGLIRAPEPAPSRHDRRPGVWAEAREGLRTVARQPALRASAGCSGTFALFTGLQMAILVLYAARALAFPPAIIGGIFVGGGVGVFLGAALTGRLTRRLGLGPAIVAGLALDGVAGLLFPLAGALRALALPLMVTGQVVAGLGLPLYRGNTLSLRQAATPDYLLGRVNASMQCLTVGLRALGALVGGMLGATVGLQAALVVGAAGVLLATTWILGSPVRTLHEPPATVVDVVSG
jgi:MFS family permease